ncbi:hypothetical protein [Nostoc sp.]|uniref:hypothetical protein n=1 Tax=Nostoc sp. TaxID=1180 RepID=UPI002FF935CD
MRVEDFTKPSLSILLLEHSNNTNSKFQIKKASFNLGFQESGAGENTVKSSQYLVAIAKYTWIKA